MFTPAIYLKMRSNVAEIQRQFSANSVAAAGAGKGGATAPARVSLLNNIIKTLGGAP